uniref:Testis expressed 48 n=1 Tax=Oryctolagus cuniculus TaxID=9986 RepID=A0A5F9DTX0_RABIT|nr:testis-expressed protein 48 [Oryctolagus cuniculus]XP_051698611.1 testis-expressed protein 48 [Oryctolagus cuniculus]
MASYKNLASKIFCLCCKDCQEPQATDDSKVPSQTQGHQPPTSNLQLPKDEQGKNPKHANSSSCLPLGQPLIHPEKRASSSSSEFEDVDTHAPQRGFYKRNLNRYSQERWPFQPCLIGRP